MGEPNWNDVSFDEGAADQAISQCQAAIDTLEGVKTAQTPAAYDGDGWPRPDVDRQPPRRRSTPTRSALIGDIDDCITNLASSKSAIPTAKQTAADTQAAREGARREWCRLHPDDEHC